ncbi:MAG: FemAB family XrtA/PEP-CTERM system-associated protein [Acidiferrobacterales bacterium]
MKIKRLGADSAGEWDAFVDHHPQSSLYHRSVWHRVIHEVFGHEVIRFAALDSMGVAGVLPLVRLRSRLFGDYMVSMPYFNYGGALARSEDIARQLMSAAAAEAGRVGCGHVEFRDTVAHEGWVARTDKVAMHLALPGSVDQLWAALGAKLRAQIRRPQKDGAEVLRGGAELLSQFYAVFSRNMRDLGTPVYPRSFFEAILSAIPDSASIVLVRHRGRPVAAGFLLGFRDRLEIPWASSLREYNPLGVNMLLYAEVLRTAIETGYRIFDFGRSSIDSGTYRFKKQWGASAQQLYWHYWMADSREMPRLTPDNPKYRLAIALWQRLPVCIANGLGPMIVKYLP